MLTLIDLFFIILIFNLIISIFIIYNFIQILFFQNIQGFKLKLKMKKEV